MKFAISGKGGVGKTTVAAALARMYAESGYNVYAVDADPDANLGLVLGFPMDEVDTLQPLAEMRELIMERTGGAGPYFVLNPRVDDVLDKFAVKRDNIKLLRMGAVKKAASECYCRENAFLNAVIQALLLERNEVVIMDMSAGIEHLTRGTARCVNAMLVVTEPTIISLRTASTTCQLARQMGIANVSVIGNKVRNEDDAHQITSHFQEVTNEQQLDNAVPVIGLIPFDDEIIGQAIHNAPTVEECERSPFWKAMRNIFEKMLSVTNSHA